MAAPMEFPVARSDSSMVIRDGKLILWGGYTQVIYGQGNNSFIVPISLPDPDKSSVLEICDLESLEWNQDYTHGSEPILGKGSVSTLLGKYLYIFGGLDDDDYHNDFYRLDLDNLTWVKLPNKGVLPCPRSYGGIVVHEERLVIIGGIGKPMKKCGLLLSKLGGEVIDDDKFGGEFESQWNNYIHEYSTITGEWMEVGCTGNRPPPLERFSFDKIDSHRALLFGGKRGLFTAGYSDIYILDLETMHWNGPIRPSGSQLWPKPRGVHATSCLVDPDSLLALEHQQIVVFWGEGLDAIHLNDIWLLHVATRTWKKIVLDLVPRKYHMCCSFFLQERVVDVVVYGGNKRRKNKLERNVMTDMIILRFGTVRKLQDICINLIKKDSNHLLVDLPHALQRKLLQENEQRNYSLYYYHELQRQTC